MNFTKCIIRGTLFTSLLFSGITVYADVWIQPFPIYSALPIFYPPAYQSPGSDVDRETANDGLIAQSPDFTPTYVPLKSLRKKNLQSFVNKIRAKDPAGAVQMEQIFAATDFIGQVGELMQGFGLNKNNVADVYAVYLVSAWQAINGDTSTKSSGTYQAVSAQAVRGLSQSIQRQVRVQISGFHSSGSG